MHFLTEVESINIRLLYPYIDAEFLIDRWFLSSIDFWKIFIRNCACFLFEKKINKSFLKLSNKSFSKIVKLVNDTLQCSATNRGRFRWQEAKEGPKAGKILFNLEKDIREQQVQLKNPPNSPDAFLYRNPAEIERHFWNLLKMFSWNSIYGKNICI